MLGPSVMSPAEFGQHWTAWWLLWDGTNFPTKAEVDRMLGEVSSASPTGTWTRVVFSSLFGSPLCRVEEDLVDWCERIGNALQHPYFVRWRTTSITRRLFSGSPMALGFQVWCANHEDVPLLSLCWFDLVNSVRTYSHNEFNEEMRHILRAPT